MKIKSYLRITKDKRLIRAALTSIMNILCQFTVIATGLVSIPLILDYAGKEDFALWIVLTTALGFISFSDFGIGIGVQDRVSKLLAIDDKETVKKVFITSFFLLSMVAIFISLIASYFFYKYDYKSIYYSVTFIFTLGICSGIIVRIFSALQQGFIVAFIQLIARLISFGLLFLCVEYKVNFSIIVFLVGGLSYVFLLIFGLLYLFYSESYLFKELLKSYDFSEITKVFRVGIMGFGAGISIYLVNSTIPYLLSISAYTDIIIFFSILYKIISFPIMLITFMFLPLWPAITEAYSKKDNIWLSKTVKKMKLILTYSIILFSLAIFYFYENIVVFWLGRKNIIIFDAPLFYMMIIFMLLSFWNSYLTTLLNGFSEYKSQATFCLIISLVSFILAIGVALLTKSNYQLIVGIIVFGYFIRCLYLNMKVRGILG